MAKIESFVPPPGNEFDQRSNEEKVKDHIAHDIKITIKKSHNPRDAAIAYMWRVEGGIERSLFSIGPKKLYTDFPEVNDYLTESDIQDWAFESMSEYGFDPHLYEELLTEAKPGGVTREVRHYPSKNIDGLVFAREREFVTESNETFSVRWVVIAASPIGEKPE